MCTKDQRYKDKSNLAPAFEWLNSAEKEAFVQSFNLICSILKSNHMHYTHTHTFVATEKKENFFPPARRTEE